MRFLLAKVHVALLASLLSVGSADLVDKGQGGSRPSRVATECTDYEVTMLDSVGGGWFGSILHIGGHELSYDDFATVDVPGPYYEGMNEATTTVCLEDGVYTPYACGGSWKEVVSFEVGGVSGAENGLCEGTFGSFTVGATEPGPAAPGPTGAICFTGDSLLTLEDGSTKKFRDLQVGMKIKGADRNGTISYSQVIFNPHPANNGTHFFVEVVTVNGKIVRMTPNHLLPLCNGGLVTARSLQPGDCVMTADGEEKVAKTAQNVEAGGIYTAVTENEFLVVDGVVASPFALSHGIAHSLFDREDVNEWCEENHHLVPAAKDAEIQDVISRRRLLSEGDATTGCVDLMKMLFENYKDEGVGWGVNGFGYKNFKSTRGGAKMPLPMRLSGFV